MYDYEKQHLAKLRPLLPECTVLLKTNGAFPLDGPCELALYGKGARHTNKGGTGSGDVNARSFVTVEEGLRNAGFTLTTEKWLDSYDEILKRANEEFVASVKAKAKAEHKIALLESVNVAMEEPSYELPLDGAGDVAVYVLLRQSGEGGDRTLIKGDYRLTDTEIRDILTLKKQYKKFMLVLNVGGPVDLSPVAEVGNILHLSQLGIDTGNALGDILLGKANPSGKLATTWAAAADLQSIGDFGEVDDTRYREGVYVGYRYYSSVGIEPLFPFGHGLSFTKFRFSDVQVSSDGWNVSVTASLENTGNYSGKEVMQVYLSKPEGELDQPFQELAGFQKSGELAPGAKESVTATFDLRRIASYDAKKEAYLLEAGDYIVRIGSSSAETCPVAIIRLDETKVVTKVRNLLGDPGFRDWRPEQRVSEQLPEDLPVVFLNIVSAPEEVVYDRESKIEPEVAKLSDKDLALLGVGNFGLIGSLSFLMGTASSHVSGASGESCKKVKGVPCLVMADGPAGLRIHPQFFRDKKGVHRVGEDSIMETLKDYVPAKVLDLMGALTPSPKPGQQIEDQYATAIPIGTAIAQSFNPEVAEACGDVVGEEMNRFGVQLWLAPALNIHRSVLCGRDFEYYSEDPLVSGTMAAFVTKGVQKHAGAGVTIKHFCANNQEKNRVMNNSCVSERAMREIYLRGFEICVRDAKPKAVMNSYNLLNGTHTSERRGLQTNILRDEFGHEGLIVTDWMMLLGMMGEKGAKHRTQQADLIAAAGTNVCMPGGNSDYKKLLKAMKNGTLSRKQAEVNASYLLRTARELNGYLDK